jgi:hypothetical protein
VHLNAPYSSSQQRTYSQALSSGGKKKICLLAVLANLLTRIPLQARAIIESAQQERKKQARRG